MRTGRAQASGKAFFAAVAAGLALAAGTASSAAQEGQGGAMVELCRCDSRPGIEMLNDLIKNARQRSLPPESAKSESAGCISSWCSTCSGGDTVRACVSAATMYFDSAIGNGKPAQLVAER